MIERLGGAHRNLCEPRRFRRGISVKRSSLDIAASRPKSRADDFVRIRFPSDRVRLYPLRRAPSREARRRQIKAPPEKMHGACFSYEPGAELFEDSFAAHEDPPESIRVFGIIRGVLRILIERDRVGNLDRHLPDLHRNPQRSQSRHELAIKIGHRTRRQCQPKDGIVAGSNDELMMDEIKLNLEIPSRVRNCRGRQAQSVHIERHAPPMIDFRSQRQPHFADDLRPHVQRAVGVLPSFKRKFGPEFVPGAGYACVHRSSAETKRRYGWDSSRHDSGRFGGRASVQKLAWRAARQNYASKKASAALIGWVDRGHRTWASLF